MDKVIPIILGVAIIAAVIVAVIYLIKKTPEKRAEAINKILFALAIEAERLYGSKTGQAKKAQVIAWVYERYKWISYFISMERLSEWIDIVVEQMTDWLASNPLGAANILPTLNQEKTSIR